MDKAFDVGGTATQGRGRFGAATIVLHWLTVLLFLPLVVSALLLRYGEGIDRAILLDIHRGAGATIWCVMLARFLWRSWFAHLPPFPAAMTTAHRRMVKASEYTLYALVLLQPITGLVMTMLRGKPFTLLLWQVPALLHRDLELSELFHQIHEPLGYTIFALIGLHGGAALVHHYILRDDVLEAMLPAARRRNRLAQHDAAPAE